MESTEASYAIDDRHTRTYAATRILGLWWCRDPFIVTSDFQALHDAWDGAAARLRYRWDNRASTSAGGDS